MEHSFNTEFARLFGIEEAIIVHNLYYWIMKNAANKKNIIDGKVWTYNSAKAFAELFPYMSDRKIGRILAKLVDEEIICKGNFSDNKMDRTSWFAFTEKGKCILQKCQFDLSIIENAFDKNDKCYIYNETNNKQTDINTDNKLVIPQSGNTPDKNERKTLFANSIWANYDALLAKIDCPELMGIDIAYYQQTVSDWSDSKNVKRTERGWLATIRQFIRGDKEKGKLKMIGGRQQGSGNDDLFMDYLNYKMERENGGQ